MSGYIQALAKSSQDSLHKVKNIARCLDYVSEFEGHFIDVKTSIPPGDFWYHIPPSFLPPSEILISWHSLVYSRRISCPLPIKSHSMVARWPHHGGTPCRPSPSSTFGGGRMPELNTPPSKWFRDTTQHRSPTPCSEKTNLLSSFTNIFSSLLTPRTVLRWDIWAKKIRSKWHLDQVQIIWRVSN